MKKVFLILFLMLFCTSQTFAACDYSNMCAPKAYDISSKSCRVTSKITGMTFFAEKIAGFVIKHELKKATKAKFKVEMRSYSAKDLMQGRFTSLKIYGKNLDIDDAYLTYFEAKTACDFNYIILDKKAKSVKFKENMVLNYAIEISNQDLKKTVQSTGYLDMLNKTKLSAFGITFFKLDKADVQLKNDKLYFTLNVTTPLSSNPIPVVVRSDIKVEEGNIVLTKIDLVNAYTVIDLSKITYLLNALNPLTFSTDILNNKNSKMKIQTVCIKSDKIYINGNVFIPKNI